MYWQRLIPNKYLIGTAQVIIRVGAVIAVLMLASRLPATPSSDRVLPVPSTDNPRLQLLRLYHQTNGVWSDEQLAARADLLGIQPDLADVNPQQPTTARLWREIETSLSEADYTAAQDGLITFLQANPADPGANLWQGLLLLPDQNTALPYLQQVASQVSPYQRLAASILSIIQVEGYQPLDVALRLVEAGEWALAERFLSLQIEADNLNAYAHAYRGYVRDQQGKNGRPDIEMALTLQPGLALNYYMLGMHERRAGNLDLSLNAFFEAARLEPDNPAFVAETAAAFQLNQMFEQAEDGYLQAIALAPDDTRFVELAAAFYAETGYQLDADGLVFIEDAVARYPDQLDLHISLGAAYLQLEQIDQAELRLQRAYEMAITGREPRLRYFMGQLAEAQRRRSDAIGHYFIVTQTENAYTGAAQAAIERLSQ